MMKLLLLAALGAIAYGGYIVLQNMGDLETDLRTDNAPLEQRLEGK